MTEGSLQRFADGVWIDEAPIEIVGMPLTSTMTVLRLGDAGLLVHSPIELTTARREAVEALGPVTDLYAPSLFHHLRVRAWAEAFPDARVHAPVGLEKKEKGLRIDRHHGDPAFSDVVDELRIEGCRLGEAVLFHRPTRTLVVADLVHNIGRPDHRWTKIYAGAMGFYDRVAISRLLRFTAFPDRAAARRSLDRVFGLPFDKIIVGHGTPITTDAPAALRAAYDWL